MTWCPNVITSARESAPNYSFQSGHWWPHHNIMVYEDWYLHSARCPRSVLEWLQAMGRPVSDTCFNLRIRSEAKLLTDGWIQFRKDSFLPPKRAENSRKNDESPRAVESISDLPGDSWDLPGDSWDLLGDGFLDTWRVQETPGGSRYQQLFRLMSSAGDFRPLTCSCPGPCGEDSINLYDLFCHIT